MTDAESNSHSLDDTDYGALIEKANLDNWGDRRYQSIDERKDEGAMPPAGMRATTCGKYQNVWCGVPLTKGPLQVMSYQVLLQNEQPATIIELGAFFGASAAWMADLCKVFGLATHVYSVDIDISMVKEKARRDNVTFIEGDCSKIEQVFPEEMLKTLPHPWFISEDAHVNVVGVLEYLLRFAEPGDVICVEDTNPDGPKYIDYGINDELVDFEVFGPSKLNTLKDFLKRNPEKVKVDRKYTDLFGYNGGLNWHGFMKVF